MSGHYNLSKYQQNCSTEQGDTCLYIFRSVHTNFSSNSFQFCLCPADQNDVNPQFSQLKNRQRNSELHAAVSYTAAVCTCTQMCTAASLRHGKWKCDRQYKYWKVFRKNRWNRNTEKGRELQDSNSMLCVSLAKELIIVWQKYTV